MASETPNKQPIALLKSAYHTLISHPVILLPFCILAFIQLLALEVIFFAPRYPLSVFFSPIISRMEGAMFMHYPFNFILITKWFQQIQVPVYVLFNSFFVGAAIAAIHLINNERVVSFKSVFKRTASVYIHLIMAAFISVGFVLLLANGYGLMVERAMIIRSTSGIFYIIKRVVLDGAPYFKLLISVFESAIFAFVIPLIIIEKRKIFSAVFLNFKHLWRSFWFVFVVVLLPSLLYVPVLLLKSNQQLFERFLFPEAWLFLLVLGVIVSLLISAIQFTAITVFYLLKEEM